jgi:hypothetical protein
MPHRDMADSFGGQDDQVLVNPWDERLLNVVEAVYSAEEVSRRWSHAFRMASQDTLACMPTGPCTRMWPEA